MQSHKTPSFVFPTHAGIMVEAVSLSANASQRTHRTGPKAPKRRPAGLVAVVAICLIAGFAGTWI